MKVVDKMRIEITPSVYLALCALVKDALEVESDAAPILNKAALELAAAASQQDLPEAVQAHAQTILAMAQPDTSSKSAA